jgi:hypothetical protein
VATLGTEPSLGIFCTNSEMIGARDQAVSSSAPSMRGAAPSSRTACATFAAGV